MRLVAEKGCHIEALKHDAQDMKGILKAEQSECEKVRKDLAERDRKIDQLRANIQQQDPKLTQVTECQQGKVAGLTE